MNRDPFLRLALVTLAGAVALAAILVVRWLDWWAFAGMIVGGVLLAAAVTTEQTPPSRDELKEALRPERPRSDSEGRPTGFKRVT